MQELIHTLLDVAFGTAFQPGNQTDVTSHREVREQACTSWITYPMCRFNLMGVPLTRGLPLHQNLTLRRKQHAVGQLEGCTFP